MITLEQASKILNITPEKLKALGQTERYKKYFVDTFFDDSKIKEFKYFYRNENHSKGTYWTRDSILCYEHKFYCKTCPNCLICQKIPQIHDKPPIKWKVLELYAELGKPKKEVNNG